MVFEFFPFQMDDKKVFLYLLDIGCCKCCALRFTSDRSINFSDINGYIQTQKYLNCDTEDGTIKKTKPNPCLICLGLLEEHVIDDFVNRPEIAGFRSYDSKTFTCSISYPMCILLREYAVCQQLKSEFPQFFSKEVDEIPLNKVWKWIIRNRIASKTGKAFNNCSEFSIDFVTTYADDAEELSILPAFKNNSRKRKQSNFGRKALAGLLSEDKVELDVKLSIPSAQVLCESATCKHGAIYVAGRYCKYSRNLSQSPWIIDNVKTMETSVQEIIFEEITKMFVDLKENDLKFSASGREDCDVRCLGKGRPFYIEINDPKKTIIAFDEFRDLECKINKSELISVRDLQTVSRSDTNKIKVGEETKTKDYVALCKTSQPVTQEHMEKINSYGEVQIKQKTPIRVLHRRPLAVRNKTIHKMVAEKTEGYDDLFQVKMVTQAGTYVKEFIHGDFGRSRPCMGDVIGFPVDILALDVVSINLDWPPEINV